MPEMPPTALDPVELEAAPAARIGEVTAPGLGAPPAAAPMPQPDSRLAGIRDVRRHVARGMLTNGVFQVGLLALTAARGFIVAAFITRSDYGLWGLVGLTLWTAMGLKSQFGAGE